MQSRQFPKPEVQTSTRRGFEDYFKDYEVFVFLNLYIYFGIFFQLQCVHYVLSKMFSPQYIWTLHCCCQELEKPARPNAAGGKHLGMFFVLLFFINAKVHMIVIKAV